MARYAFDTLELDTRAGVLSRDGHPLSLTPKAAAVLAVLVESAGEVVDKRRLLDSAWPGRFVGDAVLPQNVYTLRGVLAGEGLPEDCIETVPRRGYRFSRPVRVVEEGPTPVRSLAVLPFDAAPAGAEQEALGFAISDTVSTQLGLHAGVRESVRVVPTVATRDAARRGLTLDELAAQLRVNALVTGLVQESGGELRVNCQLVEIAEGVTRWAGSFEGSVEQVFGLEDEIAAELATVLAPSSEAETSGSDDPGTGRRTTDPVAYRSYVRGRFLWNRRTRADLEAAVDQFEQAIELDPGYASAHAGLADACVLLPFYGGAVPSAAFPRAERAARAALELDPRSAAAHTALGYSRFLYEWDWAGAEKAFRRALAEDSSYANAHHWYGFMLAALGRHEASIEHARHATELDPLSLAINADLGFAHYFARNAETALRQFELTLELDRDFSYARFGLALTLEQLGRVAEALDQVRLAHELAPEHPALVAAYGRGLALAGEREEAQRILRRMEDASETKAVHRALVYTGLGDTEAALDELELACDERSRFVAFLGVWSIYDALRDHPHFDGLVSRVGLPGGRPE